MSDAEIKAKRKHSQAEAAWPRSKGKAAKGYAR